MIPAISAEPEIFHPFVFPLYHLVELTRFFCIGAMESSLGLNLSYLLVFALVFGYLGIVAMKRRLIK